MFAIYKREMRAYFTSMIGYVYVALTLFFIGLGFFSYNLYQGQPYFSYTIQACTLILIVTIPFLTMRLIAEERKTKTDQLILTSPLSITSIVVGKFLAAYTVFAIPCAISCIYPLILRRYGIVPIGEAYVALLAFLFYGAACIAIGMFFSSLVTRQVVAAIITAIVLLLGYMMASIIALFANSEGLLANILGIYDLSTPLNYMTNGVIDLVAIFYYVTLTMLFIFLTIQSVQKRRCTLTFKNFAKSSFSIIGIVVAIVVFVAANILVKKIPDRYTSFDHSYSGIFSITDETKKYLATLDEDVNIYVLWDRDDYDEYMVKVLDKYEAESEHIKVEYIDTNKYPRFYLQYTDTEPEEGSIIVAGESNTKIIEYNYLYEYDYSNYYYTGSAEVSGFSGENQINTAIDYVSNGSEIEIFILSGHGETDFEESYYEAFNMAGVKHETVSLEDYESIPGSVSGVIINGAQQDLSSSDVDKLTEYLDNGGKILITLAQTKTDTPNLEELLDYMDIMINHGMIFENDPNYYLDENNYLLPEVLSNKYTDSLPDFVVVPDAIGMVVNTKNEYVTYDSFMTTTQDAFLKVNYEDSSVFDENEGDYEDIFVVAVEAKRQVTDESGIVTNPTIIAVASSKVFSSEMDALVNNSNVLFFSNIISSFADGFSQASVATKLLSLPYLTIESSARNTIVVITMMILPLGIIACGVYVCVKRRRY